MMSNYDYKIWCTYHDKKLINEYDLKEDDHFKLYYTKDENKNDYSINYVQLYLNEYVTQYYVWKNNVRSDFVGFCHYRRNIINYVNDDLLNHMLNYSPYKVFITTPMPYTFNSLIYNNDKMTLLLEYKLFGLNLHIDLLVNYVKENYSNYVHNRLLEIFNANYSRNNYGEIYMCTWDVFNNLMIFVEGYIKYMFTKLLNFENKELYEYSIEEYDKLAYYLNNVNYSLRTQFIKEIGEENINLEKMAFAGYPRSIGFIIEYIIGLFWNLFMNGNSYNNINLNCK